MKVFLDSANLAEVGTLPPVFHKLHVHRLTDVGSSRFRADWWALPRHDEAIFPRPAEASQLAGLLDVADVRVEQGRPAATIAALARDEGVHLSAMSTHGRGGLSRLVMGSVATATLERATVPLLLVPPAVRQASRLLDAAVGAASDDTSAPAPDQVPLSAGAPATSVGTAFVLNEAELALLEYGLEMLQLGTERDGQHAQAIRELRRRLSGSPPRSEVATTCGATSSPASPPTR
jgi:hypothetical protein